MQLDVESEYVLLIRFYFASTFDIMLHTVLESFCRVIQFFLNPSLILNSKLCFIPKSKEAKFV